MIIRIEDLKDTCTKLLAALDSNNLNQITETLALKNNNGILTLMVTNREYIVKTTINVYDTEEFEATVNASVFLKLMSQISTDTVELKVVSNTLLINGNGKYKLPMIYDGDKLLELPDIVIENETARLELSRDILCSIAKFNSKELLKDGAVSPVQKLYYIDDKGCITFTTGACVTEFNLEKDIRLLLDPKIVKLFKLFTDEKVTLVVGEDLLNSGAIQSKISIESTNVILTSKIVSDSNLINSVPCSAIRTMATETYNYSAVLNRVALLSIINRLMLFQETNIKKMYGKFTFTSDLLTISDKDQNNIETLKLENTINLNTEYDLILEFIDLKSVLDSVKDEFITFNFGNNKAIVIQRPGVYNVIPECVI